MAENNQLAERTTVRALLEKDSYKNRFIEILGKRAPQFMASIVQLSNDQSLRNCDPKSVIACAVTGATLDFPLDKSLGFAHIVPYGDKAQFQVGYKGFIQLAIRSGQFKSMRDARINAEAFDGFDDITGDPIIKWANLDETKPTVGYAFAWRLNTGFSKIVYWTVAQVETHAKRFSQGYRSKKDRSPWVTDFDSMALKTVIKAALAKWAPLSVEMQSAVRLDQGVQADIDADVVYEDNLDANAEPEIKKPIFGGKGKEKNVTGTSTDAPAPTTSADTNPDLELSKVEKAADAAPAPAAEKPADTSPVEYTPEERQSAVNKLKELMLDYDVSEPRLLKYATTAQLVKTEIGDIFAVPTEVLLKLQTAIPAISTKKK